MKTKDSYVRRHVHRWNLTEKTPAVTAGYEWTGFGQSAWHDAAPMRLRRECDDCGTRQSAVVDDETVLVPGYEVISGDLEWVEEV